MGRISSHPEACGYRFLYPFCFNRTIILVRWAGILRGAGSPAYELARNISGRCSAGILPVAIADVSIGSLSLFSDRNLRTALLASLFKSSKIKGVFLILMLELSTVGYLRIQFPGSLGFVLKDLKYSEVL